MGTAVTRAPDGSTTCTRHSRVPPMVVEGGGGRVVVSSRNLQDRREVCFPARSKRQDPRGRARLRDAYAAQPSYPAKEEVTVVVGAANSAARKRSRPSGSGSAARDSRVAERPEGMADPATEEQAPAAGAGAPGRGDVAVQDREELVAVPSPDLSVELAAADLDDADDLEDAVDLEDFPGTFDEEDLSVELVADLEIADSPDADLVRRRGRCGRRCRRRRGARPGG